MAASSVVGLVVSSVERLISHHLSHYLPCLSRVGSRGIGLRGRRKQLEDKAG